LYSKAKIVEEYPDHLKPYFIYLDVGKEIARIEIPAWIAQQSEFVDSICSVVLDQSLKGNGYPVCLAEAHEQAVIKSPDRDFFNHLICKLGVEHKKRMYRSQKSIKKRTMGI
jgi:NurA-like 5'-3' nuclease